MGFYSQKFFEHIYNFAKHIYVFGNIQFFCLSTFSWALQINDFQKNPFYSPF